MPDQDGELALSATVEVTRTARKKRPQTQRRRCLFCGRPGDMTREHVWAQWLRPYGLDVRPERTTLLAAFTRTAADTYTEQPTLITKQPGSVFANRALSVCRSCNNGWMSALEQDAKPLIVSMMSGSEVPGVILTPDQAAVLATWTVKTAWMSEESDPGERATTQQMRQTLHQASLPPENSMVWAARHDGTLDFHIRQLQAQVGRYDRPWDSTEVRHVLWTCLTFRGIAFLSYTVDGWGVPTPQRDPSRWLQIWPATADLRYPPPVNVSDVEALSAVTSQAPYIKIQPESKLIPDPSGLQRYRRN